MGSGCTSSNSSNRPALVTSDRGVKYTGPAIESLGICTGDYLDEITAVIVEKLIDYSTGEGISLPDTDFTQCTFLDAFAACCVQDKTLQGLLNNILRVMCEMHDTDVSMQTLITNITNSVNYTIVPGCITASDNKIDTVLNALISEYCALIVKLENIFTDLDNPVFNVTIINEITDAVITKVFDNISGCSPNDVVKTGTGVNTTIEIKGSAPIGSILFGKWDASFFDNTGLGLADKGMCGWHVCNGAGGTDDLRGFTLAMATNINAATALNSIVDPVANLDADYGTSIGDTKGKVKHKLSGLESAVPAHTHPIAQTPHNHTTGNFDRLLEHTGTFTASQTDNNDSNGREPKVTDSGIISPANANITVEANTALDATLAHENRQPTKYYNCIQRIA